MLLYNELAVSRTICIYVCMYVCSYVCTYISMYLCMYVQCILYICMCVCIYVCMYSVCMYIYTYHLIPQRVNAGDKCINNDVILSAE